MHKQVIGEHEARVAYALAQVIHHGRSMSAVLSEVASAGCASSAQPTQSAGNVSGTHMEPGGIAKLQAQSYAVLRQLPRLQKILDKLCKKPLSKKQTPLDCLLYLGLMQCLAGTRPAHAIVNNCVAASVVLKKTWAKGLVNACLRRFMREKIKLLHEVDQQQEAYYAHPQWWINAIKQDWPDAWKTILQENNQHPPCMLRVNALHSTRQQYAEKLSAAGIDFSFIKDTDYGICLQSPLPVDKIPGFFAGEVSMQDGAGQLLRSLLQNCFPQHKVTEAQGENTKAIRILDACAAPGSKTALMLEYFKAPLSCTALDKDAQRLERVRENLKRLKLPSKGVHLQAADAMDTASWWDNKPYHLILCDAPCSASGVIRRHPDIKILRRASDIEALQQQQLKLLQALWPCLAQGGVLIYATCSVFRGEGDHLLKSFIKQQRDAKLQSLAVAWGREVNACRYILPGDNKMDGFFYGALTKIAV